MIKITPKKITAADRARIDKYKKIVHWVLLIIFLPIALYLLAMKSYLWFFIFSAALHLTIKLLKKV